MSGSIQTLSKGDLAYNKALNNYFDKPSELTLDNLKTVVVTHGVQNADLVSEISIRHLSEQKVGSWTSTKQKAYIIEQGGSFESTTKVSEVATDLLTAKTIKTPGKLDLIPKGAFIRSSKGLPNLGNTCFGNASLKGFLLRDEMDVVLNQKLTPEKGESPEKLGQRKDLQKNLRELKAEYQQAVPNSERITELLKNVWTSPILRSAGLRPMRRQEDASEFIQIVKGALDTTKHPSLSIQISSMLGKKGTDEVRQSASSIESSISVELPRTNPTLQGSLNQFLSREDIPKSELPKKELAGFNTKKLSLKSADGITSPKSFQLTLKKFSYDASTGARRKITTPVKGFDKVLNVPISDSEDRVKVENYAVSTVVCHMGETPTSGHYVTLVKTKDGWEEHNDSFVRSLSEKDAFSFMEKHGYIVNYSLVE